MLFIYFLTLFVKCILKNIYYTPISTDRIRSTHSSTSTVSIGSTHASISTVPIGSTHTSISSVISGSRSSANVEPSTLRLPALSPITATPQSIATTLPVSTQPSSTPAPPSTNNTPLKPQVSQMSGLLTNEIWGNVWDFIINKNCTFDLPMYGAFQEMVKKQAIHYQQHGYLAPWPSATTLTGSVFENEEYWQSQKMHEVCFCI